MTDKERFRYLMARPDYWTNKTIQQEVDKIVKRMFKRVEKTIIVTLNNRIVLRGTAKEIEQRTSMNASTIRYYAKAKKTDRFGKNFRYEFDEEDFSEEMSEADV
ncbi:hypothetical protein [Enterococcus xiangfangensis]|uniref:hypothetical protein n=1 Tax=Enterococcus xiangfangensis TaxID=1296537 RepID=UPI003D17B45B|nr:hypothetical protein [Enterococcus asini]